MEYEEKVLKARKGDDNAFYELMQEMKSMLYKTAFSYVREREKALDIVSETVCKAYVSIRKLKDTRFFKTWLVRILINCCLDDIKKNKRYTLLEENVSLELTALVDTAESEDRMDLQDAMRKLNEKQRTVVILKYFQDMTLSEISDVLSCPLGTVKTHLNKALGTLRIEMKEVTP